MKHLYLMRHGQTLYNTRHFVQGRCDSPLTDEGKRQADKACGWLMAHGVRPDRIISSPLGRAMDTAQRVANAMMKDGIPVPDVEPCADIIERSYGALEEGPADKVPCNLWDPGEQVVKYGGEGSRALRARMVRGLTKAMEGQADIVLAVSHGSASLQFLKAVLEQDNKQAPAKLPNCAILHFTFDEPTRIFSLVEISDPAA